MKDSTSILLEEDTGASGVREQRRIPRRQQPNRRGCLCVGDHEVGEVYEIVALNATERAHLHPPQRRTDSCERQPGPDRNVLGARRAES